MDISVSAHNLASSLDSFAFLDSTIRTEKHDTDLTGFQVHAHSLDAGSEFDQLLGLDIAHAIDTGNTVTNRQDTTGLGEASFFLDTSNSLLEDGGDFGRGSFGIGSICSDRVCGGNEGSGCCDAGL
jgi:hypothetical protein